MGGRARPRRLRVLTVPVPPAPRVSGLLAMPVSVDAASVQKRLSQMADELAHRFEDGEQHVAELCQAVERVHDVAHKVRRARRDLRADFADMAADLRELRADVKQLLALGAGAAAAAAEDPPPRLPEATARGRSRTTRRVVRLAAKGKGPGEQRRAERAPTPTTPTSATSPLAGGQRPKRQQRPLGRAVAGTEPLLPRDLSRGDWTRLRCQVSRMVAHGHAVPGTEVRGARPADELECRFMLWAQKGWVPVATITRLLNLEPHTLEDALEPVQAHYEYFPDAAAPFASRWLRAKRGADWHDDVRAAVAAASQQYKRWRALHKNGYDEVPPAMPLRRLRRPPTSAEDSDEAAPSADSEAD